MVTGSGIGSPDAVEGDDLLFREREHDRGRGVVAVGAPPTYASLPGFRGLLVLEKAGPRNHVIAVTLWDNEEAVQASEALADSIADRIAAATGTSVTRNIYNVLGRIGVAERKREAPG